MAEHGFQEVMRQFDRMCKAHVGCINCRLHHGDGYSDESSVGAFIRNPPEIEQKIMSWAAEHPEPVYPTWWKYLCMIGVIPNELGDKTLGEMTVYSLMNTHMQSDIAQKLGIEPKEG